MIMKIVYKSFILMALVLVASPVVVHAQYAAGGVGFGFSGFASGGGVSGSGPATHTAVAATQQTTAPATTGSVLGASTYNFTSDLSYGSKGADVTALQSVLIADGYLNISSPTGWFGPLTKAAVIKYQTARNISGTGYVGPLTLASLNAGTTPTTADESASMKAAGQ
jgi:peptidoglycan hydrolase-like protein with peptidoglycan-binding domain